MKLPSLPKVTAAKPVPLTKVPKFAAPKKAAAPKVPKQKPIGKAPKAAKSGLLSILMKMKGAPQGKGALKDPTAPSPLALAFKKGTQKKPLF